MSRLIDHAKRFDHSDIVILFTIPLPWWGGTENPDDPLGGLLIFGLTFVITLVGTAGSRWWKERRKRRTPRIGSVVDRPVLVDYRHILLVPSNTPEFRGVPWAAVADADLVIREDDLVIKDRLQASDVVHPGLFQAAKLTPGRAVLDLTDETNLTRVNRLIKEKSGRADLWRFPIEVVKDGDGW